MQRAVSEHRRLPAVSPDVDRDDNVEARAVSGLPVGEGVVLGSWMEE